MVMHARKFPRIDDGYADQREPHGYQATQYPSKAGYGNHGNHTERYDRSPDRTSPGSRTSPRYINKSSYVDRTKEKFERGSENSPGRKSSTLNNSDGRSNQANSGHVIPVIPDKGKNTGAAKDKNEVQKSAIRTYGDWSEHLSKGGKKYYYNLKTEVSQWEKPRDWNDASATRPERQSTESRASNDKHSKDGKLRHSSGGLEKREKHLGDLKHLVVDGNPKPDKLYLFEKLQQSQTKLQQTENSRSCKQTPEHKDRRTDDGVYCDHSNSKHNSSRSRRDSDGSRTMDSSRSVRQTSRNDCDDIDSPGSTPTSHISAGTPSHGSSLNIGINILQELGGGANSQDLTNKALQTLQKLQQALSRQIAAAQTSVSNQTSHSNSITASSPHHPGGHGLPVPDPSLLHANAHHSYHNPSPQGPHLVSMVASSTATTHLMSLHSHSDRSPYHQNYQNSSLSLSNLSTQNSSPHHPMVSMAMAASPMMTGTTTIPITHTGNQHRGNTVYGKFLGSQQQNMLSQTYVNKTTEDRGGGDTRAVEGGRGGDNRGTEGGEMEERSTCASPAPSDTSSQGTPVDLEMFSAANMAPQKENNHMANLAHYYNDQLVSHVTGWQGELVERQARLYHDESLRIGSLISSQVSVDLKRARSLVRVEEIQSTLHEQRNLFLAQQISELESLKPTLVVSSTFLPTSATSAPNNT
ncbi:WW domain-containing adapter protein with coiled-coil-like [Dreissena polymorpha]|uniref:WW domain-containing adapter protein with coiled-coil-like n=1 Tax=Dreissena polymorpha TaxID=45954 RepID=UPI0022641A64|nr:WW domain-containing adapter protein with coiled-coil-like [Dreissena polymorpha]